MELYGYIIPQSGGKINGQPLLRGCIARIFPLF